MSRKVVYQTDHLGLFVGEIEADESPLEPGVFLIPAGCVELPPPQVPEFKAAHWNGKSWQLLDFFEGLMVYDTTTGAARTLRGLEPIPSGYTLQRPEPGQIWKADRWVDDIDTLLSKLYLKKIDTFNSACAHYIVSGFSSDALGEWHRYDSALEDQINLYGLVVSGLDALCPCYFDDNTKVFREHLATQLAIVGQHLVQHKQAALAQTERLKNQLRQMLEDQDLSAMKALEWSMPD